LLCDRVFGEWYDGGVRWENYLCSSLPISPTELTENRYIS
jgi:hypothetical protein